VRKRLGKGEIASGLITRHRMAIFHSVGAFLLGNIYQTGAKTFEGLLDNSNPLIVDGQIVIWRLLTRVF
jgi:hypothetical protein